MLAGCASTPSTTQKSTGWIKDEVDDSYVFGYPLVLMGVARDAAVGTEPGQVPLNTLRYAQALPPIGASNPMQPSLDTLDSTGWLDVGSEPVIVALPDSRGRYVDARVLDMWTNVVWSTADQFATRANGIKAQAIAFVGPGWQGNLPRNVKRVDVPTRNAWVSVRIQSNGTRDLTAVRKLQRAIRVAPLSVYTGDTRSASVVPPRSSADLAGGAVGASGTPAAQVAALDANGYWISTLSERRANLVMILVLIPFWTSILVRVAAWIVILQSEGLVNKALIGSGLLHDPLALLFNRTGVYISMTHILLPFMILPLYSVMKSIPPTYQRAAVSLGSHPFAAFWRVYVPQIYPGIGAGALLVFILAIGYYITPALLGGPNDQMVSYYVAYFTNVTINWGMACALGALLLAATLVLYVIYGRFTRSSLSLG
ncbi:MAG: Spermidine/putrescine import ABC transporter permease protein PotB (TC 3.A.1.11.1) [uncultured Paraburkholderia sp.]|nr:MAG: Spermidine/putrescine import ABC transporter permease protein PotB (TC 3.A.1.11.1) [uncultured Paraburkholderia sp.]CAH2787088.1 MAG: Spermidine/putrescine import ABC transporter permease protein PotB (TC 3.A.1.11.1) [uncultured Paraburkholderia sp.]CAH2921316.1 MAG: Spermidine/putrescine import ABC transporter permease protein PotB (TC 3.A.1.11.1) [uncultured Paraburkholderia sp.]CAH2922298.1 MAG: Spermidine/putrescine import ABC transporter permease protein PotB (TC 3.A.1.11.1) [uncult